MNETIGAQAGLRDIEAPLAPPANHGVDLALWLAVLAALAGAAWLGRRYRHSRRRAARRALARLEQRLARDETDARAAAYDLAAILRLALDQPRVAAARAPAGLAVNHARWRGFTRTLDAARYARPDPGHDAVAALVREARSWLGGRP